MVKAKPFPLVFNRSHVHEKNENTKLKYSGSILSFLADSKHEVT